MSAMLPFPLGLSVNRSKQSQIDFTLNFATHFGGNLEMELMQDARNSKYLFSSATAIGLRFESLKFENATRFVNKETSAVKRLLDDVSWILDRGHQMALRFAVKDFLHKKKLCRGKRRNKDER
ncbi:hypothetical protein L2E82_13142 [Cichorium intybus]|uniref:Uncharacterized protein n=1 Tax=Cichorium intybus TaxID=13427 RepID=A0ACB9GJ76_CICIN|nr:hypothetical protein L2E82_13142 [Cichorium intybus]